MCAFASHADYFFGFQRRRIEVGHVDNGVITGLSIM